MTKLEQSPKTTKWTERLDDPARVIGETTHKDDEPTLKRRMIALGVGVVTAIGTFIGIDGYNKAQEFNTTVNAQETAAPTDITSQNPEVIEPLVQTDHREYPLELRGSGEYRTFIDEYQLKEGEYSHDLSDTFEKFANIQLSPEERAAWEQYAEETATIRGEDYYPGAGLGAQLFADTIITPTVKDIALTNVLTAGNYQPDRPLHPPEEFLDEVIGPWISNVQRNIAVSQEKGLDPYEANVAVKRENHGDFTIPDLENEPNVYENQLKVGQVSNITLHFTDSLKDSPVDNDMGRINMAVDLQAFTLLDKDTKDLAFHDLWYDVEYGAAA